MLKNILPKKKKKDINIIYKDITGHLGVGGDGRTVLHQCSH